MVATSFRKFDCFNLDIATGLHNMKTGTTHVYKIYLTNTLPVSTNTVFGTPAEITGGSNGYTAGGASIGTVTGSQTSGVFAFIGGSDPSWTPTGPMGPFQYAVLYNSTSATQPLIAWLDYGSALTAQIGNTFTIDLDQVNGILTIT